MSKKETSSASDSNSDRIERKWKRFALGFYVCERDESVDLADVYDELVAAGSDSKVLKVVKKRGLSLNSASEGVGWDGIVDAISNMAFVARSTADGHSYAD